MLALPESFARSVAVIRSRRPRCLAPWLSVLLCSAGSCWRPHFAPSRLCFSMRATSQVCALTGGLSAPVLLPSGLECSGATEQDEEEATEAMESSKWSCSGPRRGAPKSARSSSSRAGNCDASIWTSLHGSGLWALGSAPVLALASKAPILCLWHKATSTSILSTFNHPSPPHVGQA